MKAVSSANGSIQPEKLARLARLRYVSGDESGYGRQRNGAGFVYVGANGKRLKSARELSRIEKLAIPPAWTDVWICRFASGHLQATGHDERRREQYLYHEKWRDAANVAKFARMVDFGKSLPQLRRSVERDLRGRTLTQNRVLAGMVALLDVTGIRIGNEEYVRANRSFGLATLRTRHVQINHRCVRFQFRGKGGLRREFCIDNRRLVSLLKQLKTLPGAHVFQYVDELDQIHPLTSADVNDYLREITNQPFTAKDFRTWKASALVSGLMHRAPQGQSLREQTRETSRALVAAAELLGNTVTVCRKYYVHVGLSDLSSRGVFDRSTRRFRPRRKRWLSADEQIFARFLKAWKPSRASPS